MQCQLVHQVKMEDAPSLLKITKSECPDIWIRPPIHKWSKSWSSMEHPVVPLERHLYGHPVAGPQWEMQFEKVLLENGWGKVPNWVCFFVNREKGLFLSVYVDDLKLAGKKENIDHVWKIFMKDVGLGEPTSFFDHIHFGCTQRVCQTSEDIVDNYRNMFDSRMSAGGIEKLPYSEHPKQTFPLDPMMWKVMRRNAWKDIANLQRNQLNSYTKWQLHRLTTINSKKKQ